MESNHLPATPLNNGYRVTAGNGEQAPKLYHIKTYYRNSTAITGPSPATSVLSLQYSILHRVILGFPLNFHVHCSEPARQLEYSPYNAPSGAVNL